EADADEIADAPIGGRQAAATYDHHVDDVVTRAGLTNSREQPLFQLVKTELASHGQSLNVPSKPRLSYRTGSVSKASRGRCGKTKAATAGGNIRGQCTIGESFAWSQICRVRRHHLRPGLFCSWR